MADDLDDEFLAELDAVTLEKEDLDGAIGEADFSDGIAHPSPAKLAATARQPAKTAAAAPSTAANTTTPPAKAGTIPPGTSPAVPAARQTPVSSVVVPRPAASETPAAASVPAPAAASAPAAARSSSAAPQRPHPSQMLQRAPAAAHVTKPPQAWPVPPAAKTMQPAQPAARPPTAQQQQQQLAEEIDPAPIKAVDGERVEEGEEKRGGNAWGGWGWGKLTSAVTTAVKDVSGLAESFNEMLQEVATAEDEDSNTDDQAQRTIPKAGEVAGPSTKAQAHVQEDHEKKETRQRVLEQLEGASQPSQPLQGANRALGTLWGTLTQAASTAVNDLRQTAREAGPAVSEVTGSINRGKAEFKLGQAWGKLSRTAKQLAEAGARLGASGLGGTRDVSAAEGPLTFEECFSVFGGSQAEEELVALSNECSRLCNRVRAAIPDEARADMDAVLMDLGPFFQLDQPSPDNSERRIEGGGGVEESAAMLRGRSVVESLATSARDKAESTAKKIAEGADTLLAPMEGEESAEGGVAASTATVPAAAASALQALREEAASRLGEVCSLCVERLLALGRSVASHFRFGRPSSDGIAWPSEPRSVAMLLRREADGMVAELSAVEDAFVAALALAGEVFGC
jgi:phosphoglycolate phosphatase-like HAD superfamily hydrolase